MDTGPMDTQATDPLSEMLKLVKLDAAAFRRVRVADQSGQRSPPLPGESLPLAYYFVAEGALDLHLAGCAPRRVAAGQAAVVVAPRAHAVCAVQGQPADGVIGGSFVIDRRLARPLLVRIPDLIVVGMRENCWAESALRCTLGPQPGDAGAQAVVTKLAEALLGETLRRHFCQCAPAGAAPVLDRIVSTCLALIHERPGQRWTVESLAREAHASRSVLAERFTQSVGMPPVAYLARLRMALASQYLRSASLSVARVAEAVGYETETAFSRAFRREFGLPPAAWRRAQQA